MTHKTTTAKMLLATFAAAIGLSGCHSSQPTLVPAPTQAEIKHDQEMRKQVEQLKKKSKAYPVNGSNTDKYIP